MCSGSQFTRELSQAARIAYINNNKDTFDIKHYKIITICTDSVLLCVAQAARLRLRAPQEHEVLVNPCDIPSTLMMTLQRGYRRKSRVRGVPTTVTARAGAAATLTRRISYCSGPALGFPP